VLKFLSVKTIVIPPASTGKDSNNNTAVITTAHPNKANLCNLIPGVLILTIVVMTLNNVISYICGLYLQQTENSVWCKTYSL